MAIDCVINWPCTVKSSLESLDPGTVGVVQLVELVKSLHRVSRLALLAQENNQPEEQISITIHVEGPPSREKTRQVTLPQLRQEVAVLEPFASQCESCPANLGPQAFGCVQFVQYPIPATAERWLLSRIQPVGTPGNFMLLSAFQDLGYTGEPMAEYRTRGLMESTTPLVHDFPPNRFQRPRITSDELFQPLFGVGVELDHAHLLMVLVWFGMIALDGQVPTDPKAIQNLVNLTPAQRKERCRLELGPDEQLPDAGDFVPFFRLMFRAWQLDQPLLVDS